jgi:hypothetical protein
MFAVEIYAAVRRFVFVEGKSRREAARVFGLSRGYDFQNVPLFGAARLCAIQGSGAAEARTARSGHRRDLRSRQDGAVRIEHGYAGGYTSPAPGRARPSCRWPIRLAMRRSISANASASSAACA